jgi:hypothetical protein
MAVLERSGEERARRRDRLQLVPVVAEADDQRAGADAERRPKEQVDSLVEEELAELEHRRPVVGEPALQALCISLVRETFAAVSRIRWIAAALLEQRL